MPFNIILMKELFFHITIVENLSKKFALTTFSSNYWNYFRNPQALTYVLTNVWQEYIFLHTK
jgi:hypothetical protein